MATSPSQAFLVPASLTQYRISPAAYIKQRKPGLDHLVAGTVVVHQGRVLLIQRSLHDFGSRCWEVPGGMCETNDLSILGAACRELWEEARLRATAIIDIVDDANNWSDDGLIWRKLTFLVEVEQNGDDIPKITLDPEEHEDFVWATEGEVLAGRCGDKVFSWISDVQRQTILKAFKMLKTPDMELVKVEVGGKT
ncbi:NUDIX hydrolase domain-like protein [Xylariales sp. AK1849]|nr:NUDIX hydrolase domain-like protein [Xylariales sp. AK1849]